MMFTSSMIMANASATIKKHDDGGIDKTNDINGLISQLQSLKIEDNFCKSLTRDAFTDTAINIENGGYVLKGFIIDGQLYGDMDKKKLNMGLKDVVQILLMDLNANENKIRMHLSMKTLSLKIWCSALEQAEAARVIIPSVLMSQTSLVSEYNIIYTMKISCINKCARYDKELYLNKLLSAMQEDGLSVRAPSEPQTAVILDYFYNELSGTNDHPNCTCDVPENQKHCGKSIADGSRIGYCKKITIMIHNTGTIKLWGNSTESMAQAAKECIFTWLNEHQDVVAKSIKN